MGTQNCTAGVCVDGIVWIPVAAGTYEMGCVPQDPLCVSGSDELPQHQVTLTGAFDVTQALITQGQYQAVTGVNPSWFAQCGANCPVETVSWAEAVSFCEAVGGRLPTEAEWEYADRAGTTTIYSCGDNASCVNGSSWYGGNTTQTRPVCLKLPNAWQLCDMNGDLYEWVQDWFDPNYYSVSPPVDPPGPPTGIDKVFRGGCWNDPHIIMLRASDRGAATGGSDREFGFRCVRDEGIKLENGGDWR
jgi:formylglycine-generating enzyme required for sulfatase activity